MHEERYYTKLAIAFVQGKLGAMPELSSDESIQVGLDAGLRLHKFKRNAELPRVRKALGILRGLAPETLLDVGSGRGTFLFPLLNEIPGLSVTAMEVSERRAADLEALHRGGVENLMTICGDISSSGLADKSFAVVTMLEVMEHLENPARAAVEIVRIAERFVVISVPSKEDDNPEHIHLFDSKRLEALFHDAGAKSIKFDFVLNHIIAVVKV